MKEKTPPEYFLSETAVRIWKTNDLEGQNKMFEYVTAFYKENWFKGMIYKSGHIAPYRLNEIAEEAFFSAWQNFNERGKAGKIVFFEARYTGYLKQVVHKTFIRLLQKEMKEIEAKKEYLKNAATFTENTEYDALDAMKEKVQKTLSMLPSDSASLMQWRYLQKMSYTAIAERLNILEKSCKQKLYRAKKEFLDYWKIV